MDLSGIMEDFLIEDGDFQAWFCGGCQSLTRSNDCPIDRDIEDPKCERHGLYLAICAILEEARQEIRQEMAEWGCEK